MASLEDYTFETIQTELQDEFGDSSGTFLVEIRRKINHAIKLLWTKKPFWSWSQHAFAINVEASVTRTNEVVTVQGSTAISWTAPVTVSLARWTGRIGPDHAEYIITNHVAGSSTATLDKPYVGLSGSTYSATFYHSFIELPPEYGHLQKIKSSASAFSKLTYKEPWLFEEIRLRSFDTVVSNGAHVYTVLQDPLRTQKNRQYLTFFPRIDVLTRIDGTYFTVPENLTTGSDIPAIPRAYRLVLFYFAAYLLAVKLKDYEAASFYKTEGKEILADLFKANTFVDDDDTMIQDVFSPQDFLYTNDTVEVP